MPRQLRAALPIKQQLQASAATHASVQLLATKWLCQAAYPSPSVCMFTHPSWLLTRRVVCLLLRLTPAAPQACAADEAAPKPCHRLGLLLDGYCCLGAHVCQHEVQLPVVPLGTNVCQLAALCQPAQAAPAAEAATQQCRPGLLGHVEERHDSCVVRPRQLARCCPDLVAGG